MLIGRLFSKATRDRAIARPRRHVERSLADVETALTRLQVPDDTHVHGEIPASAPEAACRARRVRRRADALTVRRASFEGERALLLRYREFFQVFEALTCVAFENRRPINMQQRIGDLPYGDIRQREYGGRRGTEA